MTTSKEIATCADSRSLGCNVKFVKSWGGIHVIHMILLMFFFKKMPYTILYSVLLQIPFCVQ